MRSLRVFPFRFVHRRHLRRGSRLLRDLVTRSHMLDHIISELRALDLGRSLHLAGEIVGDALGSNRAVQSLQDQIGGLAPADVAEHHLPAENDAAGIYSVQVGIFWGGAVSGFEDSMP